MPTPAPVQGLGLDTAGQAAWRCSGPPTALMVFLGISPGLWAWGGNQMLPSACSQLRGGPVGLPLHSEGVANSNPCFISLSESLVVPALLAKP